MIVNGVKTDSIPADDRGLAYGDGLFETILIHAATPVLLEEHFDRLEHGAGRLNIEFDRSDLLQDIELLSSDLPDSGVLKIILTRGSGGRGYRPGNNVEGRRILTLHPPPDYGSNAENGVSVFVCQQRLASQSVLAGIKHLNRLEQVIASMEWPDDDSMEGLMLDHDGNILEGTRSNIFWAVKDSLYTPDLTEAGVEGIMRNKIIKEIPGTKLSNKSTLEVLEKSDEVFLCNSVFGVWPVSRIRFGEKKLDFKVGQSGSFTERARNVFHDLLTG